MSLSGRLAASGFLLFAAQGVYAQARYNLQEPVTPVASQIYDLHTLMMIIILVIFVAVFGVMFYSIFRHRKSKGAVAAQFHESTTVEVLWTIVPLFILIGMAWPATQAVLNMRDTTDSELTIKTTGYQWKWSYDYLQGEGQGISFMSELATPRAQIEGREDKGENYLLEVDNPMVVPVGQKVRMLIAANDVIHAWWVPAFGIKQDAVPGFIREAWFFAEEEGIYRGVCAELCGRDHAYMPIEVHVVSAEEYTDWVNEQQATAETAPEDAATEDATPEAAGDAAPEDAAPDEAAPEGDATDEAATDEAATDEAATTDATPDVGVGPDDVSQEELMARGEQVYARACVACHQANGEGMPPAFPSLVDNDLVLNDRAGMLDVIINGRPGTAMAPFGGQLSDVEIAALGTYLLNAWGHDLDEMVDPDEVAEAR